jgi:hypothetical protein
MPRKPSALLQYKLRIREGLRRQIETAAKKRGVSLNYEMTFRLEDSFRQERLRELDTVGQDMINTWARYGSAVHELNKQGDLIRAVEALLKLPADADPADREDATANVRRVIAFIEKEAAQLPRRMRTTGASS